MQMVDETTIGVFVIMGSTFTGHYEPVEKMAKLLDEYEAKTGISVPIHVDGSVIFSVRAPMDAVKSQRTRQSLGCLCRSVRDALAPVGLQGRLPVLIRIASIEHHFIRSSAS